MAKEKLNKQDINEIKKDIIDDVTKEITNNVSKKVTNNIIKKIKEESSKELKDSFVFEVKNEVKNQIIKEEKKLLRHRSRKIIRRDIVIIFLIGVIAFMGYLMYKDDYVVLIKDKTAEKKIINKESSSKKENEVKDLAWYKNHYSYLIDNMHLDLSSDNINKYYLYNKDYQVDEINNSIKLSLAYNLLDNKDNKIKVNDLKKAYNKLFNDEYTDTSFKIKCRVYKLNKDYYEAKDNECLDINDYQLKEEITNIYEENDNIIIETIVGLSGNNKLYNYHDLENSVSDKFDNLKEYQSRLNSYKYTFNKNKQFISIKKES